MSAYDRSSERGRAADADAEIIEIDTVTVAMPLNEGVDGADELQGQIEQTRASMSGTIDAIQDRLNPQRIGEQVRDQVREATIGRAEQMVSDVTDSAREAGGGIVDMIRANPVPTAMAALGLGWLWMKRPSADSGAARRVQYRNYGGYRDRDLSDYGDRGYGDAGAYRDDYRTAGGQSNPADAVRQTGRRAQQAAGQTVDRVQDAAGQAAGAIQGAAGQAAGAVQGAAGQAAGAVHQAAGQVQDTAQQLGTQVQYGARRARYGLEDALYGTPLGVGAIALAVGVAIGLAAPSTDLENQVMGEARDSVVQKAQDTAQETMHKVQHVAEQTANVTKETATQEAQKEGLTGNKG
ncbi:MAG: DUF3618 domain-containing protein [Chloroflexota bacterium]